MNIPRTDNQTVVDLLMLRVEAALGSTRRVPVARAKQVGREIIRQCKFDNKEELQRLLDQQIDAAFSRTSKEG